MFNVFRPGASGQPVTRSACHNKRPTYPVPRADNRNLADNQDVFRSSISCRYCLPDLQMLSTSYQEYLINPKSAAGTAGSRQQEPLTFKVLPHSPIVKWIEKVKNNIGI
jgi:hypothetical protein